MRQWYFVLVLFLTGATLANAQIVNTVKFENLKVSIPRGWEIQQNALNANTGLISFKTSSDFVQLYVKRANDFHPRELVSTEAQLGEEKEYASFTGMEWKHVDVSLMNKFTKKRVESSIYWTRYKEHFYFGFSRGQHRVKSLKSLVDSIY